MTTAARPLQTDRLRAFVASGRLWLVELLAWLASVLGLAPCVRRALIRELDDLHRAVALLVFAEARHALIGASAPARPIRPVSTPGGCRLARENSEMGLLWRTVRRGVGLRNRIAALQAAMADVPRLAARLARRLMRPYRRALVIAQARASRIDRHTSTTPRQDDSS